MCLCWTKFRLLLEGAQGRANTLQNDKDIIMLLATWTQHTLYDVVCAKHDKREKKIVMTTVTVSSSCTSFFFEYFTFCLPLLMPFAMCVATVLISSSNSSLHKGKTEVQLAMLSRCSRRAELKDTTKFCFSLLFFFPLISRARKNIFWPFLDDFDILYINSK